MEDPEVLDPGLSERAATTVEATQLALELGPGHFFGLLVFLAGEVPQALGVGAPRALRVSVDLPRLVSDSCQKSTPSLSIATILPGQTVI